MRFLQNWSLVVALVLPDIMTASFVTNKPNLEEYTMTIMSPNVRLVNKINDFVCMSARLPRHMESAYISKITPRPATGVHHHIVVHVCDEPGSSGPGDEVPSSWDCNENLFTGGQTPALGVGQCSHSSEQLGVFTFQYHGGPVDEGTLTFPPGTGIPVRAPNGSRKTLVVMFHYPNYTTDGMSGSSGVDVTMIRNQTEVKTVGSVLLSLAGFVGPESVGTVSASWRLQQMPIHILRLYSHWHEHIIDVLVRVKKANGDESPLLHQDPHKFWGITNITDSSFMSPGDRLTFQCTYNNTLSEMPMRITRALSGDLNRVRDMCILHIFYSVNGSDTLSITDVDSYDRRTADCFPSVGDTDFGLAHNFDGSSSYDGVVSDDECRRS